MPKTGSEKSLRQRLREAVEDYDPGAHVVQVENPKAGAGTPDTYICQGGGSAWLELKFIHAPKRSRTPLRLDHLREGQIHWMAREWRAGGRAWVLLQAGRVYLLLHPRTALEIQNRKHTLASAKASSLWAADQLRGNAGTLLATCLPERGEVQAMT